MQAIPRRASRLNRSGLQPSRSNTRVSAGTPASGLVRSGAASGTTPRCCRCGTTSCSMSLISFGSSALCRHSRGESAEGVDPVAHRRLVQTQLLARRRSVSAADRKRPAYTFTWPSTAERRPDTTTVGLGGPGAVPVPIANRERCARTLVRLSLILRRKGLGLGAAVEAEDRTPLAWRLVAEALGVAYSGQRHEGDEQEDGGQAIKSVGQAEQAVGGTEQTRTQQHRQCREHAAVSDGVGGRGEHLARPRSSGRRWRA